MIDVVIDRVRDDDLAGILRNFERFWGDRESPRALHHPMFFCEFADTAPPRSRRNSRGQAVTPGPAAGHGAEAATRARLRQNRARSPGGSTSVSWLSEAERSR